MNTKRFFLVFVVCILTFQINGFSGMEEWAFKNVEYHTAGKALEGKDPRPDSFKPSDLTAIKILGSNVIAE